MNTLFGPSHSWALAAMLDRSVLTGSLAILITVPAAAQTGSFSTSGAGCPVPPCASRAVHEVLSAGAWDLDGIGITFSPDGSSYRAVVAGAPLAFSNPQNANATDDSVTGPFGLGFTFPQAGNPRSTTAIEIASNGYIYLLPGAISSSRCCSGAGALPDFLADAPSIAVLGTDLNPSAGGSVRYEAIVASNPVTTTTENVFVVEWLDVPEYRSTTPNTVQCQLWENGDVTICHVATANSGSISTALVGISPGGGQRDCAIDLSRDLPFDPATSGSIDPIELSSSGAPISGGTVTIRAQNVPPGVSLRALLLGSGQSRLPLAAIGAPPDCDLLVDSVFSSIGMIPAAGAATATFSIRDAPGTIGQRVELQGVFLDPTMSGSFAVPVYVSNRGTLVVGSPPPNDECTGAIPLVDGINNGNNTGATDSLRTGSCGRMGSDVWYTYTATCTGTATIGFCAPGAGAGHDTVIAAFTGSCSAPAEIACNDDWCDLLSQIEFPTTAGTTYYVAVGAFDGASSGSFRLSVVCQ